MTKTVSQQLPRWKAAHNAEAETVILDQRAFGHSLDETFLLACAIRYARIAKKIVMIYP